jgi:4-alpha-glucanotransferase
MAGAAIRFRAWALYNRARIGRDVVSVVSRMPPRPFLRALADHVGILPAYVDLTGTTRHTDDRARVALLDAMGIDAYSEAGAREYLRAARAERAAALLPAVRVAEARNARHIAPGGAVTPRAWEAEVICEDGARHRASARRGGAVVLPLLPVGYHRLRLSVTSGRGRERIGEQRLIVVPSRCPTPHERLGMHRAYGVLANLYTVRSASNWGFGDLSDLSRLVDWAGRLGAAFVGVNPLHALDHRGDQISPYSPVSRLYRDVLYLDVTAVPEWKEFGDDRRRALARDAVLEPLRASARIDHAGVRAVKEVAFAALHGVFAARHRDRDTARGRAYAAYRAAEGERLLAFATFLAVQRHFERQGIASARRWPSDFRDPLSPAVSEFRAAQAESVDLHCYLQFELDRQLGVVAETARTHAMGIGVYQDLALGSSRRGSDLWAFPGLFLDRIDIGAPPDAYAPAGQNWGLPPIDPRVLAASGYAYWIHLVRAALRHAGALRIDHVMGLFRQFWIPAGARATRGAYVRFPAEALLGILALESQRAGALVIGEDLGTVPRGLRAKLARSRILSTRVLYFERTPGGGFRPARAYPRGALVGANTHDLVPLAGFWEGSDLTLRRRAGLLRSDRALAAARAVRERERRALLRRLRSAGALRRGAVSDGPALSAAVHSFLARTPAALVALSLDDLAGEVTPINLPGVPLSRYPSWSRRMRVAVESLPSDPDVAEALNGLPTGPRRRRLRTVAEDDRVR